MSIKSYVLFCITLIACQGLSLCSNPSSTTGNESNPTQAFFRAVKSLNLGQVCQILQHHPEVVNAKDENQDTMLHWLGRPCDANLHFLKGDITEELLGAGASTDVLQQQRETPLFVAADRRARETLSPDVVSALLCFGTNVDPNVHTTLQANYGRNYHRPILYQMANYIEELQKLPIPSVLVNLIVHFTCSNVHPISSARDIVNQRAETRAERTGIKHKRSQEQKDAHAEVKRQRTK